MKRLLQVIICISVIIALSNHDYAQTRKKQPSKAQKTIINFLNWYKVEQVILQKNLTPLPKVVIPIQTQKRALMWQG
jgi:hypothetical protein